MEHSNGPRTQRPDVSRSTLRLTIEASREGFELVSVERLQMITPPQLGERPQAGKPGGYWIELRDAEGRVLAHRIIDSTLLNSVEVHSPEGKIQREFGDVKESVIEVLLPDVPGRREAVLLGSPLKPRARKKPAPSGEIARFNLTSGREEDQK